MVRCIGCVVRVLFGRFARHPPVVDRVMWIQCTDLRIQLCFFWVTFADAVTGAHPRRGGDTARLADARRGLRGARRGAKSRVSRG